jgi:hypothetical protein
MLAKSLSNNFSARNINLCVFLRTEQHFSTSGRAVLNREISTKAKRKM